MFLKGRLVKNAAHDSFNLSSLKTLFAENPGIENTILCSVKKYPAEWKRYLSTHSRFTELTPEIPVPVRLSYKTPKTLGMDRLAAVCGAYSVAKGSPVLVVNAGTCITYDFLTDKNVYTGGSISPGLEMRYKALHAFTDGLPLISPNTDFKKLTGSTTEESIRSGVQLGMVKEVEGIVGEYQSKHKNLKVLLTGGSANWLLKSLKIKIKAEPYLVLTGLNVILSHFHNQSKLPSAKRSQ
jgi:type III pantothenate kinase